MVLSTLALVQASSELGELKRYVENGESRWRPAIWAW